MHKPVGHDSQGQQHRERANGIGAAGRIRRNPRTIRPSKFSSAANRTVKSSPRRSGLFG